MQHYYENKDYEILTPNGWEDFDGLIENISINKNSTTISLDNGYTITATNEHRFYDENNNEILVKNLKISMLLQTDIGPSKIINLKHTNLENTFEIFNSKNHIIYAEGFKSHQCDELGFLRPNIAEAFFTSMSPTLATGGKCIITSTPNSDEDKFAEIWFGAINNIDDYGNEIPGGVGKNGFKAVTCNWNDIPGRDDEWAETEKNKIGIDRFEREYNCKFVTAEDTLISGAKLIQLKGVDPIKKTHNQVRWYQPLSVDKSYLVALDPAAGVGKDNSVIQVYSIPDMTQVAEWSHNRTLVYQQVKLMQNIINYIFDEIKKMPDNRGDPEIFFTFENNSIGQAALEAVNEIGEEKFSGILLSEPKSKGRKGLNTNGRSKNLACMKLKSLVENNRITLFSKAMIKELKFFVGKGNSFEAKTGEHDDCVMSTLLCIRMMQIVSGWDEKFENMLKDSLDSDYEDEDFEAPMPMIF
jgi:hypothetical protein